MPSQEEILQQQELLVLYRNALAHYLMQCALHGRANAPPVVLSGISENRTNIQRVKGILRAWSVFVEDHPDDTDGPPQGETVPALPPAIPTRVRLLQVLTTAFNDQELRDVCFHLNIDYESLPGSGKSSKARDLVEFVERHNRFMELVEYVRAQRPQSTW